MVSSRLLGSDGSAPAVLLVGVSGGALSPAEAAAVPTLPAVDDMFAALALLLE